MVKTCTKCGQVKPLKDRPHFKQAPKLIYISHPYSAKEENKLKVESIVRKLAKEHPEHTYISPIHTFGFTYNDFDYETGLNMCLELLRRCDMMYVFGDYQNSKGCKEEIKFCEDNGIEYKIF